MSQMGFNSACPIFVCITIDLCLKWFVAFILQLLYSSLYELTKCFSLVSHSTIYFSEVLLGFRLLVT